MASDRTPPRPFLSRLAADVRGATLAMMAAALIPLIGITGSAVDLSRLYVVKVRLQQACDAGVLAGRKAMTDTSTGTPLDSAATAQARTFFDNNFQKGWYNTANIQFTPVKAVDNSGNSSGNSQVANAVSGTAQADVPMALMRFFGIAPVTLSVACQARFDLADTDVMFVLDTTASMSCAPSAAASCSGAIGSYQRGDGTTGYAAAEASGSKIDALRQAVELFDSTMRSNADPTTHFRYGFVTYSSGVNVGPIIPSQYLQTNDYTYQSRYVTGDYNYGNSSTFSKTGWSQSTCVNQRNPTTGYSLNGLTWSNASYYQARNYSGLSWTSANGGTCSGTQQVVRPMWRYGPKSWPISGYLASYGPNGTPVTDPSRVDGLTSKWNGCIEEVDSSPDASFSVGNLPDDLDPDFIPSDADNKWRPAWSDAEWLRNSTATQDLRDDQIVENYNNVASTPYYDHNFRVTDAYGKAGYAACGMPAQALRVWTASEVHNYVYNVDFKAFGGTYHDVGMIWGTRMLSPDGIFGSNTAAWPGRNDPARNIVFMTDGTMSPNQNIYGLYGVERLDNRMGSGGDPSEDYDRHTARFRVECDAAKKKGITIYVVALGTAVTSDLSYCASPGQTFQASSTDDLTDAFKTIAQRVAMLRITS